VTPPKWTNDARQFWQKILQQKHWNGRAQRQVENIALANMLFEQRTQIEKRDITTALSLRMISEYS
jgi:hypothetical protein